MKPMTLQQVAAVVGGQFQAPAAGDAVVEAVGPHIPEGVHFVPGHPLAGTEHSGPRSGFPTLFRNRWCILVPPENADADAVAVFGGPSWSRSERGSPKARWIFP